MPEARRIFVHVGLQKTGTSYLQAALLASRDRIAEAGLDLVPPTKRECFELMVVVRNRYEARRDPESDRNTLERFTAQLREAPGSRAVYSQESLAPASRAQMQRLLDACDGREVHVVLTVRDLARGIPSAWQEELKAGGTATYPEYLVRLQAQESDAQPRRPWIHLDAAAVLRRWSEAVPADRIHVVTVPPPGSHPTALLERFARVLEVDPSLLTPEDRPSNSSLGHVQAEVLRRVNAGLPEEAHRRYIYAEVVKRGFARGVLGAQEREKVLVPAELRPWCDAVTERQTAEIAAAGYRVEGSLDDLGCLDSAFVDELRSPSEGEVAAASVAALTSMLAARASEEAARRTGRIVVDGTPARPPGLVGRLRRRLAGARR